MDNKKIINDLYEKLQQFKDGSTENDNEISENILHFLSIDIKKEVLDTTNPLTQSFVNLLFFLREYKDLYLAYDNYLKKDVIKQAIDDNSDNNKYIKDLKALNPDIPISILIKLKKIGILKDIDDNINQFKTSVKFLLEKDKHDFKLESDKDPDKIYNKKTFANYLNEIILNQLEEVKKKKEEEFADDIKSLNDDKTLQLIKDFPSFYSDKINEYKEDSNLPLTKRISNIFKKTKKKVYENIYWKKDTDDSEKTNDKTDKFLDGQNAIDFDDTFGKICKLILYYFTLACIILLFSIVVLSLVSFFQLIYEIISNIILLFVNTQSTKGTSIDYLSKNIIKCTKYDLSHDNCYVFHVQKQNLSLLNICTYTIYLLLVYALAFVLVRLYAQFMKQKFIGSVNSIDNHGVYLPIIAIIFAYASVHFFMYIYIFKTFVYIPYKELDSKEKDTDDIIDKYILIYNTDDEEPLIDNNFFEIIYDLTRIDELNTIFMNGIESKNIDNCLEQKIIIYDIYMYLREYVVFDNIMKQKFADYCTSTYDNKPYYYNSTNKITFLSLLNNNEVKMIKKYHEELAFFNNITDNNLEFYNNLNKSINKKIRDINTQIITHNKTIVPFFTTIFYIILIFFYNLIIFYIILNFVLMDNNNQFNDQIVKAAEFIKTKIYDKIINYFI